MEEELQKIGDETTCPIAMIIRDGKILHGLRHYTKDKWKAVSVWTAPGGRCGGNETLETTLRREVLEETGISDLKITNFLGEVSGAKEGDRVSVFLAETNEDFSLMEPEKFSEWKWIPLEDYKKGDPSPYINDGVRKLVINFFNK